MVSPQRFFLPLDHSAAKPSPMGVEGVMGYATAASAMFASTQTTAPEPSTVLRMPVYFGLPALPSSTFARSNVETLTFPPVFFRACFIEQVIAALFRFHVRDHLARQVFAFVLQSVDGFVHVLGLSEVEKVGGEVLEHAANAVVLAL